MEHHINRKDGIPMAINFNEKQHKFDDIFLSPGEGTQQIALTDAGGEYLPCPNPDGRTILYVAAPSQAGKTTFVKKFASLMQWTHPDLKQTYLFSEKDQDKLDELEPIRIAIDSNLVDTPMEPVNLANSLVIFDDVDSIIDKDLRKAVFTLIQRILKLGGEYKVHIIVTYHMLTNRDETRYLLFEANYITIFPNTGSKNQFETLLRNYVGLDKKQIEKILKVKSRWLFIHKNHPRYIVTERNLQLL